MEASGVADESAAGSLILTLLGILKVGVKAESEIVIPLDPSDIRVEVLLGIVEILGLELTDGAQLRDTSVYREGR
jgi:hypothetical protein